MLNYIAETGEISDKQKFVKLLTESLPEGDKKVSTLAQEWLREGEERGYEKVIHAGVQQGIAQGVQQGEYEKAVAIARNMLSNNFDHEVIKKLIGLKDQDIAKLVRNH